MTMHIQFSLIISVLLIDSPDMGSTSTNHGNGYVEISGVQD
jgi:hypothetical protein